MKNKRLVKALSAALPIVLAGGSVSVGSPINAAAAVKGKAASTVLDSFVNPDGDTDAKPMVRFWFPDAGAGLSSGELQELKDAGEDVVITDAYLEMVSQQITELYEAGFGGVEMTMLSDGTKYDNTVADYAGWGTKAWTRILTQALYTANSLGEGKFKVDITMTAHWPLIIDTIDPNDDEQQQQTASAVQTVTDTDLEGEAIQLALPEQRHKDTYNTVQLNDSDRCASFLFVSKLVGATLAIQNRDGTLEYDSLTSIDAEKAKDSAGTYKGYAAGVPGTGYIVKKDGHWQEASNDGLQTLDKTVITDAGGTVIEGAYTKEEETQVDTPWGQQTQKVTKVYDRDGNDITDSSTILNSQDTVYTEEGKYFQVEKTKYTDTFGIKIKKQDEKGNIYYEDENGRRYMDDWQYLYEADTADVKAAMAKMPPLEEGQSYVLVNAYREGTGCISSGGTTTATTMNNRTYEIDYYNQKGVQQVVDYWEENMLDESVDLLDGTKSTLREQLGKSGVSCIFEDSLELSTSSSFWSAYFVDPHNEAGDNKGYEGDWERLLGYKVEAYLPILYGYSVSGDNGMSAKIKKDSDELFDKLFDVEHRKPISEWAHTIGGGYRFQCSSNLSEASNVDVIEADNGTLNGDGIRTASSTVNVKGDQYLSMEAITSTTSDPEYFQTMMELNMNFSGGINRVILHGCPFTQAVVNEMNYWPGWGFADDYWGSGYGAWNSRQPLWENVDIFSDYVTRIQGLLQNGTTKIPVLFVGTGDMQSFLDAGYHYNVASEDTLMIDAADPKQVVEGVLNPDGLGTQVLVLNGVSSVDDVAFLNRLREYADKGLKIVLYNGTEITEVNGVEATDLKNSSIPTDKTNEAVRNAFAELKKSSNVITDIGSEEELLAFVKENTDNTVEYDQSGLEVTHLTDAASDYYFFWNNYSDGKVSYGNVGVGLDMTNVTGLDLSAPVTLDKAAQENIYKLDAYTGEITEITDYQDNGDGTVTVQLELEPWDAAILAVSPSDDEFEAAGAKAQAEKKEGMTVDLTDADWNLTIRSYSPTKLNDDAAAPFYKSTVTDLECKTVKLGLWEDLKLSTEQLASIGITAEKYAALVDDYNNGGHLIKGNYLAGEDKLAAYISGIGYYTTEIDWNQDADGAYLYLNHRDEGKTGDAQVNMDMIMEVTVVNANGEKTTIDKINPLSDRIDLGEALSQGKNEITVKLTSTLRNREILEGSLVWRYDLAGQGLTSASIQGYTKPEERLNKALQQAEEARKEAEEARKKAEEAWKTAAEAKAESGKSSEQAKAAIEAARKAQKAAEEAQTRLDRFEFAARRVSLKSIKSAKPKNVKITWKKVSGADGYIIQYSTKSSLSGGRKLVVKKGNTVAKTFKKLKSRKKYYFRVRAYKTISGKKVYTNYSNKKSVRAK